VKKVLSSILISFVIFANLLAPFSVGWGENGIKINTKIAGAEVINDWFYTKQTQAGDFPSEKNLSYEDCTKQRDADKLKFTGTGSNFTICTSVSGQVAPGGTVVPEADPSATDYYFTITTGRTDPVDSSPTTLEKCNEERSTMITQIGSSSSISECKSQKVIQQVVDNAQTEQDKDKVPGTSYKMPACSLNPFWSNGTVMGCIGQAFYYVLFVPTSYLFALAGTFFDSTFAYSVQDTSYRSTFVVQGWGLVRDFCNIFFIFILLYVAISTILDVHNFNTKGTIINVVVIGLFINFSLFATQVIIDASNITARVFYNSDAIKLTEKGVDGAATAFTTAGEGGVIPMSEALVNKVNPQNLILHAEKINEIPDKGGSSTTDKNKDNMDVSTFILVVLMASAVNIVGFTVFLSVGMIFIVRVIGLWVAMILAPLAFFTYILPEKMGGIKMIGWKNWWPETLSMAFLAPIFMFFMYIILKFLEMDLISDATNRSVTDVSSGLGYFVATLIPFAFIMILMMKAKGIAKNMAGEMGEMASKAGATIGGMALGGAVGIGAVAMRGTVGRLGNAIANSETLKKYEAKGGLGGKALRNIGAKAGSGSFDVRATKLGGMAGSGLGVNMGKAKEGGFKKIRADKMAQRTKRAEELKLGPDSKEKIAERKAQADLKRLENEHNTDIEATEAGVAVARQESIDAARRRSNIDKSDSVRFAAAAKEAQEKEAVLDAKTAELKAMKTGGIAIKKDKDGNEVENKNNDGTFKYRTTTGNITKKDHDEIIKKENGSIAKRDESKTKADDTKSHANTIKNDAASTLTSELSKIDREEAEAKKNMDETARVAEEAKKAANEAETKANGIFATAADKTAAVETKKMANDASIAASEAANKYNSSTATKDKETAKNKAKETIDAAEASITSAEAELSAAEAEVIKASTEASAAKASAAREGGFGRSINEVKFEDIKHAHHAVHHEDNARMSRYAKHIQSDSNKVINMIFSGGQHSSHGADESADNIRMGIKTESSGGGGHGGGGGHTPPASKPSGGGGAKAAPAAGGHGGGH